MFSVNFVVGQSSSKCPGLSVRTKKISNALICHFTQFGPSLPVILKTSGRFQDYIMTPDFNFTQRGALVEACVAEQLTPRTLDLEVWGSSLVRYVVSLDKEQELHFLSSPRCINGYRRHTAGG